MTTRGRKPRPGRIMFVGSGPGDPALLTTRAATVLANAPLVFIDPDVPEPVLALIGKDLPPVSGPAPAEPSVQSEGGNTPRGPLRTNNPRGGVGRTRHPPGAGRSRRGGQDAGRRGPDRDDVVRLVAGDPLSVDAVITEVNAVARSHLPFEMVPGLAASLRGADLRGHAAGLVAHRRRRARRGGLGRIGRGARAR